jgi:hypothetical protein
MRRDPGDQWRRSADVQAQQAASFAAIARRKADIILKFASWLPGADSTSSPHQATFA